MSFPHVPDRQLTPPDPETDCSGNYVRCLQCGCYYDGDFEITPPEYWEDIEICKECIELHNDE